VHTKYIMAVCLYDVEPETSGVDLQPSMPIYDSRLQLQFAPQTRDAQTAPMAYSYIVHLPLHSLNSSKIFHYHPTFPYRAPISAHSQPNSASKFARASRLQHPGRASVDREARLIHHLAHPSDDEIPLIPCSALD